MDARRLRALAAGVLVIVAVLALARSWQRWLDPVIDVGRDLYIPGELLEGRKLYRDILYFYPPLTPYLLAGSNLVLGRSLLSYTILGILLGAVTAWQLWRLGRLSGAWEAGAVGAWLFLTLSFTGASTWGCNFLFPYAHAAVFGMVFVLLFECFLMDALMREEISNRRLWPAILFGFLAAWTKIEFALLVAVTLLVVALRHRVSWKLLAGAGVVAALSFVLVSVGFADSPPGQHWLRDQVLAPTLLQGAIAERFYGWVSGTVDLWQNLLQIVWSVGVMAILIGGLRFLDRRFGSTPNRAGWEISFVLVAAALSIFVVEEAVFRSWAVFQLALLPAAWRNRKSPLFLLLLVSLLSTWRIFFRLSPDWYGFVLMVPAYVALAYVLIDHLPALKVYSRRAGLLWIPVLLLAGVEGLDEQRRAYALKEFPVATPRGTFYDVNPDRAAHLSESIRFLIRSGFGTMVVIPEGLTLNYFTGIDNPTPFHTFTPIELDANAESRAIVAMEANSPDTIVLLTRDVSEFGFRGFGVDYGRNLLSWIQSRYVPVRRLDSDRFQILILRQRDNSKPSMEKIRIDGASATGDGLVRPALSLVLTPTVAPPSAWGPG